MSNTQLLYTYLTNPREGIRFVLDHPPHILILAIFLIGMLNSHISAGISNPLMNSSSAALYLTLGYLLKISVFMFSLLILTALIHFLSDLSGFGGSVSSLFLTFLFSYTPYLLLAPVMFLPKAIAMILSLLLLIWVIWLQIKSTQEVYRLSSVKAMLVYLGPLCFLFIIIPVFLIAVFLFSVTIGMTMIPTV